MSSKKSMYGVFIIESLRDSDFPDGKVLNEILELSQIRNTYLWVKDRVDFLKAIMKFKKSGFRYLHLSCHADMDGIEINGEGISNNDLAAIFKNQISKKRVFLSACEGSNRKMATAIINKCSGQSVIGSPVSIRFDKSVLFWPSFYHVINEIDENKMNRKNLSSALKRCVDLFEIPINYYHASRKADFLKRYKFRHNRRPEISFIRCANNL